MNVNVIGLNESVSHVLNMTKFDQGAYVCVPNVHMCLETFDSKDFRAVVNQADLVISDGKPFSVAQKLLGHKNAAQVRGQDIMNALCAASGKEKIKALYGFQELIWLIESTSELGC